MANRLKNKTVAPHKGEVKILLGSECHSQILDVCMPSASPTLGEENKPDL